MSLEAVKKGAASRDAPAEPWLPPTGTPSLRIPEEKKEEKTTFSMMLFQLSQTQNSAGVKALHLALVRWKQLHHSQL